MPDAEVASFHEMCNVYTRLNLCNHCVGNSLSCPHKKLFLAAGGSEGEEQDGGCLHVENLTLNHCLLLFFA